MRCVLGRAVGLFTRADGACGVCCAGRHSHVQALHSPASGGLLPRVLKLEQGCVSACLTWGVQCSPHRSGSCR